MEKPQYNSLTESLIQSGILSSSDDNAFESNQVENFFNSALSSNEDTKEDESRKNIGKKRINQYDLELLKNENADDVLKKQNKTLMIIKRFIEFKHKLALRGQSSALENLFFAFFPKLYKARLVKEAMAKFSELDIDTKTLLDKTIPYGESETRYQDLIKYLNYANELQTKIKKGI